jgi:hypothetical protein
VAPDEVAAGRPYRVIGSGVFVADPTTPKPPAGELVAYGTVHIRRDGNLRYDPRGLHYPLTADQLAQFLTEVRASSWDDARQVFRFRNERAALLPEAVSGL